MFLKFREILNNRKNEDGVSLIFALLVLVMLLLVTVIVATTATTSAVTANQLTSGTVLRSAATNGLQNALLVANNSQTSSILETKRGVGGAVYGTVTNDSNSGRRDGEIKWRWYTEQVVFPGQIVGYYVYSTGYSSVTGIDKGVTLRAQFVPTAATSGDWNPTTKAVSYKLSPEASYQWGITGTISVSLEDSSKVYGFDSYYGSTPGGANSTGTAIATNNTVTIGSGTGIQSSSFTSPSATGNDCTGTGCAGVGVVYREFDVNLQSVADKMTTMCGSNNPPIWRASEHGGVLDLPANTCVGGLIFDVDTTVPANYTPNSPLAVYSVGDVTVNKGINVNTSNSPGSLKVYSNSGALSVGVSGSGSILSRTNMYMATVTGLCEIAANSTYFGATACGRVIVRSNAVYYLDAASRSGSALTQRNVWTQTYVEEL